MAKETAINTFGEGLSTDLHPLTTPNSVLTDCINGTIITYNGNELVLQNDSGNYKLKNSELTPNFIPVGIKEHSNIIYIVSYNPLTKETEVGSYPSPEVMQTTKDGGDIELIPLIEKPSQALVKISNINTYNNLRNEYKYVNISDLDMYPGDVYELQITDGENGESLSDL